LDIPFLLGDHLSTEEGVVIGRAAYLYINRITFTTVDSDFFRVVEPCPSHRQVLARYIDYCE
jgi:hypothetical protein